jgi:5'-3' exonuclease
MGSAYYHFHAKEKHVAYNFIKNLREIIQTYKVDKTFILCEGGGSIYRKALHPGYKATRKANREKKTDAEKKEYQAFLKVANELQETLKLLGVAVISSKGSEADDVAAYLCSYLPSEEYQILLLSEDSDWNPLLSRVNTVQGSYKAMVKGELNRYQWKKYAACTDEFGFDPARSFVKKMMIGDTSDDIPGLDGIGKGFAAKIVELHPTLAEIVTNKDNIMLPRMTAKAQESLANCEETFKLGFQLMNLHWPEEKWAEILGEEAIPTLREGVARHLQQDNYPDTLTFREYCYEMGWLLFTEDEEFFTPFLSKKTI